jgi:hypothetical protein
LRSAASGELGDISNDGAGFCYLCLLDARFGPKQQPEAVIVQVGGVNQGQGLVEYLKGSVRPLELQLRFALRRPVKGLS